MFKKLLQNLPFNPSLLDQVGFYSSRLRQEASIRRLSVVFMVLTLAVQFIALAAPPQSTLAASTNDIVYGGIGTSDPIGNMLRVYDNDTDGRNSGIRALFESFKISREDIAASRLGTINSRDKSLYSLGRNPHSVHDQPHDVAGKRYYLRPLHVWGSNKNFSALIGTRSNVMGTEEDRFFAIIIDCGNITVKLRPQPSLSATKTSTSHQNGSTVMRGETIRYRVLFSNVGSGTAHLVTLTDAIPQHTTYKWHGSGGANKHEYAATPQPPFLGQPASQHVWWEFNTMAGHLENWYVDLDVIVNDDAPDGAQICNTAFIRSLEVEPIQISPTVCLTVTVPETPQAPPPPPPTPEPGQPLITKNKRASNLTQNIQNAHESTAKPGDVISYQLLTINSGDATYEDFQVIEEVNDILEYATVTEISDNGELDKEAGTITWKPADIKADETLTRSFKIQVNDPLPSTPRSSSDPLSYDLRMDNVYGNEIHIHLAPPSIAKATEHAAATLPNTGPGTSVVIGFVLTVFISYFFARSRLMAKELDTVKAEYAAGGGF